MTVNIKPRTLKKPHFPMATKEKSFPLCPPHVGRQVRDVWEQFLFWCFFLPQAAAMTFAESLGGRLGSDGCGG